MLPGRGLLMRSPSGGGSSYVETGEIGNHITPDSNFNLGTDFKSVIAVTVPVGGVWVKHFHILMRTATAGNKLTPVLYNGIISSSTLVKSGQEYVFPSTFGPADTDTAVDWNADGSAYFIPAGNYGMGVITIVDSCRGKSGSTTYWNADTYAGGAASPFGTVSSSAQAIIVWCPYSVTGP